MPRQRQRPKRDVLDQEQPSATIALAPKRPSKVAIYWRNLFGWDLLLIVSVIFTASAYMFLYIFLHPSLDKLPSIQGPDYDTKLWGSYRPHLYFGMRTRSPTSPLFGMMWYEQPNYVLKPHIRHWCNQGDGIDRYGWYEADARTFGKQNITESSGRIQTDWINESGSGFSARIKFNMKPGKRFNVIFYMASTDNTNSFRLGKHLNDIFYGQSDSLGRMKFSIHMKRSTKMEQSHSALVVNEKVPIDRYHDFMTDNMQVIDSGNNNIHYILNNKHNDIDGRFVAVQLNFGNSAEFDIALSVGPVQPPIFEKFDAEIARRSNNFNRKYENAFGIAKKNYSVVQQQMAKFALSNMLGGVGYWYGLNRVYSTPNYLQLYGPHTLFSAVPSRPFFPRGFLWDEGFHNMLIRKIDPKLSLEIITSYMNLMETSGWIPREVILGAESEAKVPAEFIPQHTDVANPPSFFYVVDKLVHDEKVIGKYGHILTRIYPRLEKWFLWLRSTQFGPSRTTFRWRGRNETIATELNPKTLSSGLDDYPRASHPTPEEYHLDLRCWLALCGKVLERLSKHYGTDSDHRKFSKHKEELNDLESLVRDHWSEKDGGFFDFGKHSDDVGLAPVPKSSEPRGFEYQRVTSRAPVYKLVTNVYGYNSLYPMMFRMFPADSKYLKATLDKIRDPKVLWTPFGLRSISKSSPYYQARNTEHDPPYWRGNIWININYMTLSALRYYADQKGPHQVQAEQIFQELRKNLVNNMAKEFRRTGHIWENYNDITGEGQGTHPFTGWSSLILMIMSDNLDT
ncbi:unnamed protein product [Caenorhabditis bovis]|uniref:Mannosyl-oligosaccharide glucosidase n=1 Tax=Caenorhabditis bovis TaxID=2654633 RepID=A0A8S1F5X6_9PELO|nr:unnamed protein product [Caenorhabditis bovis]